MSGDERTPKPKATASEFDALLVEPSKFFAGHMASLLAQEGGRSDIVSTGEEAKARLAHGEYELICISRRLDDMTGPQLARFIRAEPGMASIPLFMVTAEQDHNAYAAAYAAGFTEVFFRGELERLGEYLVHFARGRSIQRRLVGRVLYLEDTRWLAAVTIGVLHNLGLGVDHFTSVEPALEAFDAKAYDLVITDIVLEGARSGLSLLRAIRALPDQRATIPILAMSGLEDASRRIELFRSGVSDYVVKPVVSEELVARVSNMIINKQLLETVQSQQDQLHRMATVDVLTGLYNRRHLGSLAGAAIAKARSDSSALSLMMLDLDGFKRFNDTHGHQAGDSVLSDVGQVLNSFAEEIGASASRFGGEEFLVLVPGTSMIDAAERADELRSQIEQAKPGGFDVTISIGVDELRGGDSFEALVERADTALYRAKEEGRNRVCFELPVAA